MPWCFREHWVSWRRRPARVAMRHSFRDWITCALMQRDGSRDLALALGFLVADEDGGILYLRWRFWRPSLFRRVALAALLERALEHEPNLRPSAERADRLLISKTIPAGIPFRALFLPRESGTRISAGRRSALTRRGWPGY